MGVILLFKITFKQNFLGPPGLSEMCLLGKKIDVLAQLCSSMSYNAVSCEFMVTSQLHIYNKVFLNRNTI